jgi:hypothetical protein
MRIASSIALIFLSSYRAQIISPRRTEGYFARCCFTISDCEIFVCCSGCVSRQYKSATCHGHFTYRHIVMVLAFGRRANDTCGTGLTDNWHSDIVLLRAQLAFTAFSIFPAFGVGLAITERGR